MKRVKVTTLLALLVALLVAAVQPALAKPAFGMLFYNGGTVRTIVPPAAAPHEGVDNLYVVTSGGVDGQLAIAAVTPGDTDYHGGRWAFHSVSWNEGVTPYLLTSEHAVQMAAMAGDVTVTRVAANDFNCPVQP